MNLISPEIERLKRKCGVIEGIEQKNIFYPKQKKDKFCIPENIFKLLQRDDFQKMGYSTIFKHVKKLNFYVYPCKEYANVTWVSIPIFKDFGFKFKACYLNIMTTDLIIKSDISCVCQYELAMKMNELYINSILDGKLTIKNNVLTIKLVAESMVLKKE